MSSDDQRNGTALTSIDLFAGPGGWDHGIEELGIRPLGIEWDDAACATREARGLLTLQADVSELDPADFEAELLIGSPPCQAFSVAGKGDGQKDVPLIVTAARALSDGEDVRAELRERCADKRSLLVVEPLRWALALRPRWIALEQVPPVMELWRFFGELLSRHGYECWGGVLSAERYGVPQTRERAFLLASLDGTPHPPRPTHQAYEYGVPATEQHTIEGTLLPWVSMAEALGWEEGTAEYRLARGEGMLERHDQRPNTPDDPPAPVMTSKARTATWVLRTGKNTMKHSRNAQDMVPYERPTDQPAPTLDSNVGAWKIAPEGEHIEPPMRWKYDVRGNGSVPRPQDEPAPTLTSSGLAKGRDTWVHDRPATTIAGDSRVFQPGGHHQPGQQSQNAVKVSIAEASILQGFPADYPWQGSRTKQFEQVGNAVPPPLARAVISSLVGIEVLEEAA